MLPARFCPPFAVVDSVSASDTRPQQYLAVYISQTAQQPNQAGLGLWSPADFSCLTFSGRTFQRSIFPAHMQRAALLQALQASRLLQGGSRPPRGLQLLYSGIPSSPAGSVADTLIPGQAPAGMPACLLSLAAFHTTSAGPRLQGGFSLLQILHILAELVWLVCF